jgi:isopentenyldiphosphate isomerase
MEQGSTDDFNDEQMRQDDSKTTQQVETSSLSADEIVTIVD